ncbi:MAG TPA: glycosyltransferase 87 family protein [Isosphaeraceae bacterium]|nr:glycosyltransferase 87 family protein [Isosphaeraceae bacterium]
MSPGRTALVAVAAQAAIGLGTLAARPRSSIDDTYIYHHYATLVLSGRVPYRDFAVEYPPLALPVIVAPALVARDLQSYRIVFGFEMISCQVATALLVAAWAGPGGRSARALAWFTLFAALQERLILARFDAWPALLAFAAALAWSSGRGGMGGFLAALGTLAKVFPALVAGFAPFASPGGSRRRGAVAFVATMAVGVGLWRVVAGWPGVAATLDYHIGRGIEYGSVLSCAQMLAAKLAGASIVVGRDHVSFSTTTPWTPALVRLALPLQAGLLLVVWGTFVARGSRELPRYCAAALFAFILGGKVFSPQYLIWPIPFLAALDGPAAPRARLLFAAGLVATTLAPSLMHVLGRTNLYVILAYNAKNLVFLSLLAWLTFGPPGKVLSAE